MALGRSGMMMRERQDHGFRDFILMTLLKEGPLTLQELEERLVPFISMFLGFGHHLKDDADKKSSRFGISDFRFGKNKIERRSKGEEPPDIGRECDVLLHQGLLVLDRQNRYGLTEKGMRQGEESVKGMQKAATTVETQFLEPSAAARNTIVIDSFLALIKLSAGFLGGSVGLIADGADAAVDTVSASAVWIGLKLKRELLGTLIIVFMMFVTACSVGYESIIKIFQAALGTVSGIAMPHLVIVVESMALVAGAALYLYQGFVGKRNGSLALISQSIDSKNHIYLAGAVIVGALLSISGIHFVDGAIGAFIAGRITVDAVGLSREMLSSMRGESFDLSKYRLPFEESWYLSRLETFRAWILYSIKEDGLKTRDELVTRLEKTFKPKYVPVFSEFKFGVAERFDFDREFDDLIKPLIDQKLISTNTQGFELTEAGKSRVNAFLRMIRFREP
jgi:Co/Zn/Cd efflux system component